MDKNWIRIIETTKEDKILDYLKNELDKSSIEYRFELEEKWTGTRIPEYIGKIVVYVQNDSVSEVEKIISLYYNQNGMLVEENENKQQSEENYEDEIEVESKQRAKKQKLAIKIYVLIVICMVISLIIAGILA